MLLLQNNLLFSYIVEINQEHKDQLLFNPSMMMNALLNRIRGFSDYTSQVPHCSSGKYTADYLALLWV